MANITVLMEEIIREFPEIPKLQRQVRDMRRNGTETPESFTELSAQINARIMAYCEAKYGGGSGERHTFEIY
jgi:hypothetical protein